MISSKFTQTSGHYSDYYVANDVERFWHFPFLVFGKSLSIQLIINLLSNISSLCIGECITNDGCQQTHSHKYDERIQQKHTDTNDCL